MPGIMEKECETDNVENIDDKKKRRRRKGSKKKQEKEAAKVNFITVSPPVVEDKEDHNVIVTFITKQQQYAIPRSPISVSDDIDPPGLNKMISTMLTQSGEFNGTPPQFNFLVEGMMLHNKLKLRLNSSDSINREGGVTIEYLEQLPMPTPLDSLNHDNWVSSLNFSDAGFLLTGCYDHTVNIWRPDVSGIMRKKGFTNNNVEKDLSDDKQAHRLNIPDAHKAPVKVVSWIPKSNNRFITGSIDQAVLVWEWNSATNKVRCVYRCKGHTQSIESLAVTPDGSLFATGSWDGALKIWTTDEEGIIDPSEETHEPRPKKTHGVKNAPKKKAPRVTLSEHSQSVSGLVWPTLTTLASCSWDHSVRLWDVEAKKKLRQYVAPCACLSLDSSPFNNMLLVTTIDKHVRLLDPREAECLSLCKVYTNHSRWANAVKWSPSEANFFATAGFDNKVKVWDIRSPLCPLFDLSSHEDKVLALDWSRPGVLFSGSADTNVKMFGVSA